MPKTKDSILYDLNPSQKEAVIHTEGPLLIIAGAGTGKTTAHTDTFHGRFVKLVTNEQVVEVVEFETTDPALRGEMTITYTLTDADGGTDIL